jgi:CheY-like chemotaxis protein
MKSILVADGDDRVADLFADLFTREGWTVTRCRDGQHAANTLAARASYDVPSF